jgi:uncharacterized protein YndB with AHSA1/START domain
MTAQSYTTTFTVEQSPREVFEAVTHPQGWWSTSIDGTATQVGDEFRYEVPGVHKTRVEIAEVVPDQRVTWRFHDNWLVFVEEQDEWDGTSATFEITPVAGGTELRFTHVGLVPQFECYEACAGPGGWGLFAAESLRELIVTGKGRPIDPPTAEQILKDVTASMAG